MTNSKHYCIFSAQYPPNLGGVENFTYNLAKELAKNNEVTVVTNATEFESKVERSDSLTVYYLPCFPLMKGRMPLPRPCAMRRKMITEICNLNFDGVLVNTRFYMHSLLGMKIARKQGLTPVVLDHGSAYLTFGNKFLDVFEHVYENAVTAWGKQKYEPNYYGISQKSVEWLRHFGINAKGTICNAIDAEGFRNLTSEREFRTELNLDSNTFIATFVGRFIPEKGIRCIIDASKNPEIGARNIVFVLAGSGPLQKTIDSNLSPNLRCVGRLSPPDTSALLQTSNVHVLPTRSEGFSTALLEASACGLPSIVTDVGGAHELIPSKEYGNIICSMNTIDLSDAVKQVFDNHELLQAQSDNCKKQVKEKYSWNATADIVLKAFKNSINEI